MKEIYMSQIKKIAILALEVFEEQDNIYPDMRTVRNKERAIQNTLKIISKDQEEQRKIYDAIEKEIFNYEDCTYKPMCNNLRNLGYTVVERR
ncbi:hypothetical protein MVQ18_09740 [Fusobacterium necrophorum]|uniref:Uncharacterized protein n=1 Tax=Fusobacterium necrophorum DJ-2 TaxID=1441737 RepID=A0AB73C3V4_9FUSO|nr:hypothetical protein [Fusobacterium necrophorum]KDE67266.1 hypothetical protein FUSO5_00180 [Fusobacterium necrophorum BFTR-1]KDE67899.1 hypothetical protein FUSO4_01860 [Fusobacterium necrophorum DJ-1]KDE72409.1 hypothetical protein FUSO8_04945 [Fusobacterium necrophorum DJ-2]MBR8733546.1 hypothetical protein [Fusobacterium necrophorum]MBR8789803.1 hypothetical protein [Fusobacterium necrophorum]